MIAEHNKYEEWMSCIANTRLLFNSISELENFLEAPSIHTNGIKRCFASTQRLRSAFRDLALEFEEETDGYINLKNVIVAYKKAWIFFRDNLSRRNDPFSIALELLRFYYPPYATDGLGRKKRSIFEEIGKQGISIPFIILMLLKIIPGYDSKNGDISNMPMLFDQAMALLEKFTDGGDIFATLPAVTTAKEEPNKTRISLLYHVSNILDTYESFAEQENIYEASNAIKNCRADLEIEGYWNECDGKLLYTSFWHIEQTKDAGCYFATHWKKDADNNLTGIRYTLFLVEAADGNLIAYILHPMAIKHRMKGIAYTDKDHIWYKTAMPIESNPDKLFFCRTMPSSSWQKNLNLTRVTDSKIIDIYKKWFIEYTPEKPLGQFEYEFYPNLYAITKEHLYIPTGEGNTLYQIPKSSFNGFEQIHINDNVGIMKMGGRTYLAFDEFLLYIPTNKIELKKYDIKIVEHIE